MVSVRFFDLLQEESDLQTMFSFRSLSYLSVMTCVGDGWRIAAADNFQLEKLRGQTILLFTPHPDDDTFCCAGTLALLARNENNIHIVIYTNDDKGSYDPEMTSQRLASIRMGEEEEA